MFNWIKKILKHFIPPPVNAFNREMDRIHTRLDTLETDGKDCADEQARELEQQRTEIEKQSRELGQQRTEIEKQSRELGQLRTEIEKQSRELTAQSQILTQYSQMLSKQSELLSQQARLLKQYRQDSINFYKRTTPQPRISYFALNILDHCNLRCKGCDHFAAIAEKRFVEPDSIRRDLEQMSRLTEGAVTRIGVMGGEPLLHPQLCEILKETRRFFPNTLIQVVSNGLLMLQQKDAFWETCRDNRIMIVVTKYPLNLKFQEMEDTAERWSVAFRYYGNTGEVIKTSYKNPLDPTGMQNPIRSFMGCYHANQLPLLMEGKLYPCPIMPNACHFNKKFGTAMVMEKGDYLDIYEAKDSQELLKFLCTPKPFCRYCKTTERSFGHPWEQSKQVAEEWL